MGKRLKELKAFTTPWEERELPGTTPSTKKYTWRHHHRRRKDAMGKGSCRREAGKGENIGNGNKYNIQEEREKRYSKVRKRKLVRWEL